ncbi:MAG TPA: S1 RNA-binding domain-containing protein [Bacillota bacterium]
MPLAANRQEDESDPQGAAPTETRLAIGQRVTAVVTGITHYGVFVATRGGQRGLIHISEIADWFVEDARDYFWIGEEIEVEVIDSEPGTNKYAFSTRRLGGKEPLAGSRSHRRLRLHHRHGDGQPAPEGQDEAEILTFLRRRIGSVSEEARQELARLIARHGAVRVALAVADVTKRFDGSLALIQWVGRRLEKG